MKRRPLALALAASALMTAAVFRHQLRHDDFVWCFESVHLPLWTYLWTAYGGHIMPVHRIVYAVLRPLFGLWPLPYFGLAFVTHLASVYLLYRIIFRLTEQESWAAFWAGLWGTALTSVGTLVLFPTYGQAEATFFTLLVLHDLLAHRERGVMPGTFRIGLWTLALLLSALSFGIGTSAAFGIYVCAALLLRGDGAHRAAALVFASALAIFLSYVSLQQHFGDTTPFDPAHAGFALESFGLLGVQGIADLFFPALFSVTSGEEAVGPLKGTSESLVMLLTVLAAALVALPSYLALRTLSAERRRAWLALAAMAVFGYALIALGRTATILAFGGSPQSLARAIRYHYFALAFVTASFAVALSEWKALRELLEVPWVKFAISTWAVVVFMTSLNVARTFSLGESQQAARARKDLVEHVEDAARNAPAGATVYVPNTDYPPAWFLFAVGVPRSRFPNLAAVWLIENRSDVVFGHPIRFVEKDPAVVRTLRERPESPVNRILVTSNEAGEALPQAFALGEPRARALVLRGIYDEDEKGYAWTKQVFTVRLGAPLEVVQQGGVLSMAVYVPDLVIAQNHSVVVTPRIGGKALMPHTIDTAGLLDIVFDVPRGATQSGENDIEFALDKRFIAQDDDREFGILVHRFEIRAR